MAEAHSNTNEDIYEDMDASPTASHSDDALLEDDCSAEADSTDLWIVKEIITNPKEAELKKAEKKLYMEILKAEKEKRKEEKLKVSDYNEIQKQLLHLQKLIAEKDDQIADLEKKHSNVLKNICSLYKTAKSESNQKDLLLKEANEKVDILLYKRNLPKDYFERQSSQTSSQKRNETSQDKSKEDITGQGESSKQSTEAKGSDTRDGNLKQSSGQHKRLRSPSSDAENLKTETSTHSNKRQNRELNNVQNTTQSANKESLDRNQKCDSNIMRDSLQNSTTLIKTESLDREKDCDLNNHPNTACIDNGKNLLKPISDTDSTCKSTSLQSENLDKRQNPDMDSAHIIQSVNKDYEPSVEELFFQMQEMINNDPETLNDPDTINLIFDNLLPDQLKQWFAVYETSQMTALNKLKQSFVNSYFQQCSANTAAGSSKLSEEKSDKPKISFFFQQNSCPKTDCNVGVAALDEVSNSKNKPHETIKDKEEVDILSRGEKTKSISR